MNLAFSDDELRRLAEALAPLLADRLGAGQEQQGDDDGGYLAPEAAAAYLGVSRKRIYDLTSMRVLVPDGRDGGRRCSRARRSTRTCEADRPAIYPR